MGVVASGYGREREVDFPGDSVWCAHGAGFVGPWDQVRSHMHVDSGWGKARPAQQQAAAPASAPRRMAAARGTLEAHAPPPC